MKYIVADWVSEEPIKVFDSESQRQAWMDTYVTKEYDLRENSEIGYYEGKRIEIYEE